MSYFDNNNNDEFLKIQKRRPFSSKFFITKFNS